MIPIKIVLWLLFTHWVSDFVMQSDWMAQNKSKKWSALLIHCGTYAGIVASMTLSPMFGLINGIIHVPVDYVTSRINSKLLADKKVHWFFVSVGFDQFIHFVTLILTWYLLNIFPNK